MRKYVLLALVLFLFLSVFELHSREVKKKYISFELISEKTSIAPGSVFHIAIKAKMDKGWHIYWKNPGDGGRETIIKLTSPSFIKETGEFWQYPDIFKTAGFAIYGYEDEVYFLYRLEASKDFSLEKGHKSFAIKASVDYLLCEKVCLPPNRASLSINLKLGKDKQNKAWDSIYSKISKSLPVDLSSGLGAGRIAGKDKEFYISLGSLLGGYEISNKDKFYFFSKAKNIIKAGDKQSLFTKGSNYYLGLKLARNVSFLGGVLVFERGLAKYAFSIKDLPVSSSELVLSSSSKTSSASSGISIWLALLLGFIGGIILNLMPCVFPVLSLKVLSFVEQSGGERSHIRLHGIVFTIGVLVSFWVLVFFLVFFKEAGDIRGWGYQLQNSLVVMILGLFFFVFALNLFGLFEIGLSFSRLGGVGQSRSSNAYMKSFITGVLITVSATPCSAPFLGPAIGFTITQSEATIFLVFTFIALGLSFPYLLFSFFPSLLRFLPRPGAWMVSFKQSMGFLLMATVVFLVWVLGKQSSIDTVLYYLLSLIIVSLAFWVYGRWFSLSSRSMVALLIFLVLLFSGFFLAYSSYKDIGLESAASSGIWKPFDIKEIERLKGEGELVFVDFTAAWCFTCQTNKIALHSTQVETKFKELGIHTFIADWTKENAVIGKELRRLGRNAVPVYVFYRGDEDTVFLPDILTKDIILSALDKIGK